MLKITICSKNPVKIQAVTEAFASHFTEIEYKTLDLSLYEGISSQPMSSEETLKSALSRLKIARTLEEADYYVSLEGGLNRDAYGTFLTWYIGISNNKGRESIAGGGRMAVPSIIYDTLINNPEQELGEIMDELIGEENIKQKGGSTAIFTDNRIMRKDVFKRDIILALVPFVNETFRRIEMSTNT